MGSLAAEGLRISSGDARTVSMTGSECAGMEMVDGLLLDLSRRVNEDRRWRIVRLVVAGLLCLEVEARGCFLSVEVARLGEALESLTGEALTSFDDVLGVELTLSPRAFDSLSSDGIGGTLTDNSGSPGRLFEGVGAPSSGPCDAGGVDGGENQPRIWFIEISFRGLLAPRRFAKASRL
jgi:hypothetical protein